MATGDPQACQLQNPRFYSRLWRPYPLVLLLSMAGQMKNSGLQHLLQKAALLVRVRLGQGVPCTPALNGEETLGLRAGEWVRVKPASEILGTLDPRGRNKGLAFLPDQLRFCGQRLRVFKRVEKIFLEESRQLRKTRNTVLLEGALCDGAGMGCDRSCFYYWREAWLERVDGQPEGEPHV